MLLLDIPACAPDTSTLNKVQMFLFSAWRSNLCARNSYLCAVERYFCAVDGALAGCAGQVAHAFAPFVRKPGLSAANMVPGRKSGRWTDVRFGKPDAAALIVQQNLSDFLQLNIQFRLFESEQKHIFLSNNLSKNTKVASSFNA